MRREWAERARVEAREDAGALTIMYVHDDDEPCADCGTTDLDRFDLGGVTCLPCYVRSCAYWDLRGRFTGENVLDALDLRTATRETHPRLCETVITAWWQEWAHQLLGADGPKAVALGMLDYRNQERLTA